MSVTEDTIRKLLAKAESTDNEAEAAIFFAKAEALMVKYGIENVTTEEARSEEIVAESVTVFDPHFKKQVELAARVAPGFNCRVFYTASHRDQKGAYRNSPYSAKVTFVGFSGDVRRAIELFHSLNIQMPLALKSFKKSRTTTDNWLAGNPSNHVVNHSFMAGFISRVGSRLLEAKRAATVEMAPEGSSTALCLVDRAKQVSDYMKENYQLRAGRGGSRTHDSSAYGAGSSAGSRASLGGQGIGGTRGSLGR